MNCFKFYFTFFVIFNLFFLNVFAAVKVGGNNKKPINNKPGNNKPSNNNNYNNRNVKPPGSTICKSYSITSRCKIKSKKLSSKSTIKTFDTPHSNPVNDKQIKHNKCLEELEEFKICGFDYEVLSDEFADTTDICRQYNDKKCQEFFKSPFDYVESCRETMGDYIYELLNPYGNDEDERLSLEWDIAERNLMCAQNNTQSDSGFCNLHEQISLLANEDFDSIENIDAINEELCNSPECHKYVLEYFVTLKDVFDNLSLRDNDSEFCEKEIDYLSSELCKTDEELHENCLNELKPFEVCGFKVCDFEGCDYSVCDVFYEAKCPEFYKSPYDYAPSCKVSMKKHTYNLINQFGNSDQDILYMKNSNLERKLFCARNDNQSSGNYCQLYKKVSINKNNLNNTKDIRSDICNGCRVDILDYYTEYYNINKEIKGEDNETVKLAKSEMNFIESNTCINHSLCLSQLEPFESCQFDFDEIFKTDGDFSEVCQQYQQNKCEEFFNSFSKFAPACVRTYRSFSYPLLINYNVNSKDKIEAKKCSKNEL